MPDLAVLIFCRIAFRIYSEQTHIYRGESLCVLARTEKYFGKLRRWLTGYKRWYYIDYLTLITDLSLRERLEKRK